MSNLMQLRGHRSSGLKERVGVLETNFLGISSKKEKKDNRSFTKSITLRNFLFGIVLAGVGFGLRYALEIIH